MGDPGRIDLDKPVARLDQRTPRGKPEQDTRRGCQDNFVAQPSDDLPGPHGVADSALGHETSVACRFDDVIRDGIDRKWQGHVDVAAGDEIVANADRERNVVAQSIGTPPLWTSHIDQDCRMERRGHCRPWPRRRRDPTE